MTLWKFNCYKTASGGEPVDDWYASLPAKAQAKLDTLIEHFKDLPHTKWGSNYLDDLTGYEDIFEIRFSSNRIVYRPLGFFGPGRGEFTFLIGAREHGDRFEPVTAPDTARDRMGDVRRNKELAHECSFTKEDTEEAD
jgi:hypothetical protein